MSEGEAPREPVDGPAQADEPHAHGAAFDVDGSTVAFVLSSEASAASSVQELDTFLELANRVVQSVDF